MNKKVKNIKKYLNDNPKYKAIAFFGIYFLFFLFLAIFSRVSLSHKTNNNIINDFGYEFSFEDIEYNNYNFNYNINLDNKIINYTGNHLFEKERFKFNDSLKINDYYKDNNDYYLFNNNLWNKVENPYKFSFFYDINNIKDLLKEAKYNYKTNYESGRIVYNYIISSENIVKIDKSLTNLDNVFGENEIFVLVNEDGSVDGVSFKLNNYCKNLNLCVNELTIELKYDSFGKIKEITSPLV